MTTVEVPLDELEGLPPILAAARGEIRYRKDGVPARGVPVEVRVFGRAEVVGECWEWRGRLLNGYGKVKCNGKDVAVHRVAWEAVNGPISDRKTFVCHRCDNRCCVNPAHLFLGSALDNNRDRHKKGRTVLPEPGPHLGIRKREQTHCIHGHEFTTENTYITTAGHRSCRTCQRVRELRGRRVTVEVSSEELQEIAFRSGETLHMGGPFPVCHANGTTYWARVDDVTIPSQRDAGAES